MGAETKEMGSSSSGERSLPLFSLPTLRNLKHSGNLCSPLHTNASVPFRWEEQPGKPLHSSNSASAIPKCLDLPPRLLLTEAAAKFINKSSSPTTVLHGPDNSVAGRSISFSFLRKGHDGAFNTMVLGDSSRRKDKGLFGSWRRKTGGSSSSLKNGSSVKSEVHGGSFVFPSITDDEAATMKVANVSGRRGLSQAKSHFWATISGTFKQAIPRSSNKLQKDTL